MTNKIKSIKIWMIVIVMLVLLACAGFAALNVEELEGPRKTQGNDFEFILAATVVTILVLIVAFAMIQKAAIFLIIINFIIFLGLGFYTAKVRNDSWFWFRLVEDPLREYIRSLISIPGMIVIIIIILLFLMMYGKIPNILGVKLRNKTPEGGEGGEEGNLKTIGKGLSGFLKRIIIATSKDDWNNLKRKEELIKENEELRAWIKNIDQEMLMLIKTLENYYKAGVINQETYIDDVERIEKKIRSHLIEQENRNSDEANRIMNSLKNYMKNKEKEIAL